jgi:hypothetical protein
VNVAGDRQQQLHAGRLDVDAVPVDCYHEVASVYVVCSASGSVRRMRWRRGDADVRRAQSALCARVGVAPVFVQGVDKLGASRSLLQADAWPVRGLRHPPEAGTCGWYLYAYEYSTADDFFLPQHARHVFDARPELTGYLGLPPGWGFVLAPGYEDVFQDDRILRPT